MNNEELIKLIDELRALPKENEWVEFKKGTATTNERLGKYISALSNAACIANVPFAYLVFGIDDNTQDVVGTNYKFKNRKEDNQELELWIRRLLDPSVPFQHYICDYNGYYIELFRIPAAVGQPTNFKKTPHIRFNSSLTDLRNYPHYIRHIYNSQVDWSAQIIEEASIDDLDKEAIRQAREKYKEKKINESWYDEIDEWNDIQFLDKLKVTARGKITNTAILLLGKTTSAHLISPAVGQITWRLDTAESAYEHFDIPLFLSVNNVIKKIRNVQYKFFPDNQLVSVEVPKYDSEVILEGLNNCIAHQDYSFNSRIILIEETFKLTFISAGSFFEGKAEDYSLGNITPQRYRNKWLADAMVSLNMIDTMGRGIWKMYKSQKKRYFPLPDYARSTSDKVVLEIYGHSIDEKYSKLLIEKKDDLTLTEAILLDKIQKSKPISDEAAKLLRKKGLIEGRKPNYYISSEIAAVTNQKASYTKNKGLNKQFYKDYIIQHIQNYGSANRSDIDALLNDKLPENLTDRQRKIRINNILSEMSGDTIQNIGSRTKSKWILLKE